MVVVVEARSGFVRKQPNVRLMLSRNGSVIAAVLKEEKEGMLWSLRLYLRKGIVSREMLRIIEQNEL